MKKRLTDLLKSNKSRKTIEKLLAESVQNMDNMVILDAGCGDMQYQKYAINNIYLGVDFGKVYKYYPHGSFINADLADIPIESNTVDLIWCIQVLEHIRNPSEVLDELYRVAKEKTKLIITLPFIYQEHEIPYDSYRYTRYGVRYLLEKSNWKIVKIEPLETCNDVIYQLLRMTLRIKPQSNTSNAKKLLYSLLLYSLRFISILVKLFDLGLTLDQNSTVVKNWQVIAIKNELPK
jgi:SAM-dependent methyltransferase